MWKNRSKKVQVCVIDVNVNVDSDRYQRFTLLLPSADAYTLGQERSFTRSDPLTMVQLLKKIFFMYFVVKTKCYADVRW